MAKRKVVVRRNGKLSDNLSTDSLEGIEPIGVIKGWHKTMPGTPQTLPSGWVELPVAANVVLNDPESPYHNQVLPNLNRSGVSRPIPTISTSVWIMRVK